MNLSAARDELRARGFDGLTDARCNTFLNAGKNTLEDMAPWPWLEASASGAVPLTISDLKAIRYVYNTASGSSLEGADSRYLRDTFGADLTVTGTGSHWYLSGLTTLNAYPTDTSSVTVDYIKFSPELAADGDEPLFPARLHPIWIDYAVVEAYMDADEPGMAQSVKAKADGALAQQVDVFFNRNLANPEYQTLFFASEDW